MQAVLEAHRAKEKEAQVAGKQVLLAEAEIKQLLKFKTVVNASIHPDTHEPVPWVMRMCAFVPSNVPIIFGMLMSTPTPMSTAFWQWINQTYNAGMNFGNRNASSQQTAKDILFGYSAAVLSSVGISYGLRKLSHNATKGLQGGVAVLATSVISYVAVASAGFLNTYCMRMGEMERGIKVFDADGESVGVSKECARRAVLQTAFSRTVLSFPIFILPGVSMALIDKAGLLPRARAPKTLLELSVIAFALWVALPISVSLFPPTGEAKSAEIEPEFRELRNAKGQIVDRVYYNKGL